MTSSSSPTSRRARRVLACPRSPRKTRSWPARIAFSMAGRTVSSKPTIPGKTATPSPSRARRFARSSCLTVRGRQPEARSSPRVIERMSGCWVSAGTFTRGVSVGREAGRWPGLAAYAAVARCVASPVAFGWFVDSSPRVSASAKQRPPAARTTAPAATSAGPSFVSNATEVSTTGPLRSRVRVSSEPTRISVPSGTK